MTDAARSLPIVQGRRPGPIALRRAGPDFPTRLVPATWPRRRSRRRGRPLHRTRRTNDPPGSSISTPRISMSVASTLWSFSADAISAFTSRTNVVTCHRVASSETSASRACRACAASRAANHLRQVVTGSRGFGEKRLGPGQFATEPRPPAPAAAASSSSNRRRPTPRRPASMLPSATVRWRRDRSIAALATASSARVALRRAQSAALSALDAFLVGGHAPGTSLGISRRCSGSAARQCSPGRSARARPAVDRGGAMPEPDHRARRWRGSPPRVEPMNGGQPVRISQRIAPSPKTSARSSIRVDIAAGLLRCHVRGCAQHAPGL